MTQLVNHNEQVRRAADYIQAALAKRDASLTSLLDDAGMRFNLTPLDALALERIFRVEPENVVPKEHQPAQAPPDTVGKIQEAKSSHNTENAANASTEPTVAPMPTARRTPYVPACARGRGSRV